MGNPALLANENTPLLNQLCIILSSAFKLSVIGRVCAKDTKEARMLIPTKDVGFCIFIRPPPPSE